MGIYPGQNCAHRAKQGSSSPAARTPIPDHSFNRKQWCMPPFGPPNSFWPKCRHT
jgi:hypothetical protein